MSKLNTALKAVASFTFQNTDSSNSKRLCLFPGHFDTLEMVSGTRSSATVTEPVYSNIIHITDAGYNCDQVAYDNIDIQKSADKVTCKANSKRTKWADFLRYIQLNGLRVTKMRIKNLGSSDDIFNQELEISASAIGGKVGSDFINLSEYVSPNAYDRSFIDIDLSAANLTLDNTTLAFLDVPANANFSIQFTIEAYLCPAGVWTIGWGHTSGVSSGDACTEEQAEAWLTQDLKTAERTVENMGLRLSQAEFDALVSLAYNIGSGNFNGSTLLRLLKQSTEPRPEIEKHWKEWRMANGTALKGLERRRAAEYTLYSKGFFDSGGCRNSGGSLHWKMQWPTSCNKQKTFN